MPGPFHPQRTRELLRAENSIEAMLKKILKKNYGGRNVYFKNILIIFLHFLHVYKLSEDIFLRDVQDRIIKHRFPNLYFENILNKYPNWISDPLL